MSTFPGPAFASVKVDSRLAQYRKTYKSPNTPKNNACPLPNAGVVTSGFMHPNCIAIMLPDCIQ